MGGGWKERTIVRKERRSKCSIPDEEFILIETDVFSSCFDSGEYKARDFADILDYTEEEIYFLPYLHLNNDMSFRELVRKIVASEKYKFIFRENYLQLTDYIKLLLFPYWCRKFCKGTKVFKQIDVTKIVNTDIISSIRSKNSVYGILNYFFVKRIKKQHISLKSLIGWYEGQPSSLGLFKAFHENYQESTSVGYEGYPADRRVMQCAPSPVQRKYQVAPRTIGIIGQIFETTIKQFDDKIDVIIVPPFRMKEIFSYMSALKQEQKKEIRNVMLVALPYNENDAAKIINNLRTYEKIINQRKIHILLKNHPTKKQWTLKEYGVDMANLSWEFVDGSFDSVLQNADILLTCASSTVYEAVVMGKKVILVGSPSEIVLSFIPLEMEKKVKHAVVYNENDFENAIDIFTDCSCEALCLEGNRYLEKIDCKTTDCLLNRGKNEFI